MELDAGRAPTLHATGTFRALDFEFSVETTEPELRDYLDQTFGDLASTGQHVHRYGITPHKDPHRASGWRVELDGAVLHIARTPAMALAHVLWHLNRSAILSSQHRVLVHAAAGARDGRAVILPAPSGAGKTTLVAGLLMEGVDYLSDEVAAIELETGLVHPYAKPLSVDRGSFEVLAALAPRLAPMLHQWVVGQWHLPASAIGGGGVAGPSTPVAVVVPRYEPHRATELLPITRAHALRSLVASTFNIDALGAQGIAALAELTRRCVCYDLTVSNLAEAAGLLDELLTRGHAEQAETPAR